MFPQVAGTAVTQDTTSVTSRNCNLPASIASGDLLLLFFTLDTTGSVDTPSGWNRLHEGTNLQRHVLFGKVASGSEGSTVSVTTASEQATAIAMRITDWYGSMTGVEYATPTTGASGTPDPPSLTASWGAEDNLWIGCFGCDSTANISAYPSGLPDNRTFQIGGGSGAGTGVATRNDAVDTYNPGTFSYAPSEEWVAGTVVVRPAGTSSDVLIQDLQGIDRGLIVQTAARMGGILQG